MKRLAQRVSGIDTTIFATMSELAIRTGSVNLGQGFPDTDGPDEVREAAVAALRGGRNQYAPGAGVPELRRAVAAHQRRWYGMQVDPDTEVVVTTGATEAVAAALLALVEPGDEVVVLEPYYDSYPAGIALAGGVRRPVALLAPEFRVDLDGLRAAITPRTTAILLNSPHNPTGAAPPHPGRGGGGGAARRGGRGPPPPGWPPPPGGFAPPPGKRDQTGAD